jgi:uncharacterized protein (UPF0248 family)
MAGVVKLKGKEVERKEVKEMEMRKCSVREILNKLKWHPDYDFSKVLVVYTDRLSETGTGIASGSEISEIGHKFLYLKGGGVIPQHRVVEILYDGETVWKKF